MRNSAICLCILIALLIATSITIYFSFYYAAKDRNKSLGTYISQQHVVTNDPIYFSLYK